MSCADSPIVTTVDAAIAATLAELGVTDAFGLMGDDTAKLVAELPQAGISFLCARHENTAVMMAAGYSFARHQVGVCVLSRGPGISNGFTAVVDASRGGSGVLVLTGDQSSAAPSRGSGPDAKRLDIRHTFQAAGVATIRPAVAASVLPLLGQAYARAAAGETIIFALPHELNGAIVEMTPSTAASPAILSRPLEPNPVSLSVAVDLIKRSQRPLILAGRGVWASGATKPVEELARRTGAVLATTLLGQGMFEGQPMNAGIIGSFSHSVGRRLHQQADLVIAIGAGLNRYTTSNDTALPNVPVIQIDNDPEAVGRYHRADVAVIADARLAVESIVDALEPRGDGDLGLDTTENRQLLAEFDVNVEFEDASTTQTVDPRVLLQALDRLLPADRSVVTDVGNAFGFIAPYMKVPDPDSFRISTNFSAIGLGFGTALGVAVARASRATMLFVGDGALLMTLGELETAARADMPLVVIVMNDHAYGAERHYLDLQGAPSAVTIFPDMDFASVAAEFGIESATVRSVKDVEAVAELLAAPTGPILLDCKITPTVVAHFISG
jgi:thiamine pyrophosphate-dependent acetolactate synthase large subunit-like protein